MASMDPKEADIPESIIPWHGLITSLVIIILSSAISLVAEK